MMLMTMMMIMMMDRGYDDGNPHQYCKYSHRSPKSTDPLHIQANTTLRDQVLKREISGDQLVRMSSIDLMVDEQKEQIHCALMKNLEYRQAHRPVVPGIITRSQD